MVWDFLTHSSIVPSFIHAFSWQQYSQPVGIVGNSLVAILPFCLPLKINIGGNFVPSAHTVTARVAHLVPCVEIQMVAVFTPLISKVYLEWEMKKTGVWFILIMYFLGICLTYFFLYLLHEIECIWYCLCKRAWRFMNTHPVLQSLCLQQPVHNQLLCTISFGTENLTQIRCLPWHNSCCHYHSLLTKLKDILEKKIIKICQ